MIRVADYIAKFIYEQGVKDVFMLSGIAILHLADALVCNKKLNIICLHHEQAVSMAVEAYAKTTDNFGVGFFTTGPGGTNAITGLAGAWLDSVPCLYISGQVKRKDAIYKMGIPGLRQVGVQEINIIPIVESITKYSAFVDNPMDIRYHLEKAFYMAKEGRPGPVWLDIPSDVQEALIEPDLLKGFKADCTYQEISDAQIETIARYILSASRPVILAGHGVRISGAIDSLLKLACKLGIPIVTTYLGIDVIDSASPVYIGRLGIKGDRAGNLAVQNSDLILVIGCSLAIAETSDRYDVFGRDAKIIVVDIDEASHRKNTVSIDHFIKSDAKQFLNKLSISLDHHANMYGRWLEFCVSLKNRYPVCLPEYEDLEDRINVYYFLDRLSHNLSPDDAVVTDCGSAFFAGSQAIKIKQGMRYITSGGLGTMGYNLPASIGVSVALGKRRVICITGDGSFQLNIQELQSIIHYRLPVKIFILNNEGYLSIRVSQARSFVDRFIGESPASGVSFPDASKIATAYGIKFVRISDNKKLDEALDIVLGYDGPAICEIMTPSDQMIIPTMASEKKEDGTVVSKPMEDMYPFLDRKEFKSIMIVKPLE
jgi:acetolactate synthase-1/2/3 large subunit